MVSIFKDLDVNASGVDGSKLYRDLLVLIQNYVQLFKNIDMNTSVGNAFKYRLIEVLLNHVELVVPLSQQTADKLIIVDANSIDDGKYSYTPFDLEEDKFTFGPYEGSQFTDGYYENTAVTMIGEFGDVSINEISSGQWVLARRYNFIPEAYIKIDDGTLAGDDFVDADYSF